MHPHLYTRIMPLLGMTRYGAFLGAQAYSAFRTKEKTVHNIYAHAIREQLNGMDNLDMFTEKRAASAGICCPSLSVSVTTLEQPHQSITSRDVRLIQGRSRISVRRGWHHWRGSSSELERGKRFFGECDTQE